MKRENPTSITLEAKTQRPPYAAGQLVELLFHVRDSKPQWRSGYVVEYVECPAEDRPYRVKVVNLTWPCAPECVRPQQVAA